MVEKSFELKHKILSRLAEKKKFASAKNGIAWLLMLISGLILLTLFKISILFSSKTVEIPIAFWACILVLGGSIFSLQKAKHFILEGDLSVAKELIRLTILLNVTVVVGLILSLLTWSKDFRDLHHFTISGFIIFASVYLINVAIASLILFSVFKKLKAYEIHSMQMDSFNSAYIFQVFLFAFLCLFGMLL
jgi:hypothetical protein